LGPESIKDANGRVHESADAGNDLVSSLSDIKRCLRHDPTLAPTSVFASQSPLMTKSLPCPLDGRARFLHHFCRLLQLLLALLSDKVLLSSSTSAIPLPPSALLLCGYFPSSSATGPRIRTSICSCHSSTLPPSIFPPFIRSCSRQLLSSFPSSSTPTK